MVEDNQLMRISPTKTRESKNTSSVPAVRIDPRGRRDNCKTTNSTESQIMEEAPSASSSDTTRTSYVPTRPSTKPARAALADIGICLDAEPGA